MPKEFELDALSIPLNSEIRTLLDRCGDVERILFADGEYLIREGDDSQEIYVVLRGSYVVEQKKASNQGERGDPLAVLFADVDSLSFVGEMAYLGTSLRTASVRCAGAVFTLCLRPEHLDVIMDEFPFFARSLCKQFAHRLKEADDIIRMYRSKLDMDVKQVMRDAGDTIVGEGEAAEVLYQLIDGSLLKESAEGVTPLAVTRTPEDFLNARAFFSGGPNEATFYAKTPAILVAIGKTSRLAAIRNFPELAQSLLEREA